MNRVAGEATLRVSAAPRVVFRARAPRSELAFHRLLPSKKTLSRPESKRDAGFPLNVTGRAHGLSEFSVTFALRASTTQLCSLTPPLPYAEGQASQKKQTKTAASRIYVGTPLPLSLPLSNNNTLTLRGLSVGGARLRFVGGTRGAATSSAPRPRARRIRRRFGVLTNDGAWRRLDRPVRSPTELDRERRFAASSVPRRTNGLTLECDVPVALCDLRFEVWCFESGVETGGVLEQRGTFRRVVWRAYRDTRSRVRWNFRCVHKSDT